MSSDDDGLKGDPNPTIRNWRARGRRDQQRVSNAITRFSGSMTFVVIHAAWFAAWIVLNLALPKPFDPFPFGLLTLIVSLEAIFLSTFVLIAQNQQSDVSAEQSKQDFQTNVYSEVIAELVADKVGVSTAEINRRYQARIKQSQQQLRQTT